MTQSATTGEGSTVSVRASRWRRFLLPAMQCALTAGILAAIVSRWGLAPFREAVLNLPWWTGVAAMLLGGIGVVAQGLRWRVVARHHGIEVGSGAAVARCWQAAFLNSVLPGGIAGDLLRAADDSSDSGRRRGRQALAGSAAAVAAERLAGTVVVFSAAAAVLIPVSWGAGMLCLAVAGGAAALAWRWLRVLSRTELVAVAVLSVLGWAAFVTLFVVTGSVLAAGLSTAELPAVGAVSIAGMSVPLGVGGWGPREAAAAWSFMLFGHAAQQGVTVSISYGVLALFSTLPGAVIAAFRAVPMWRRALRAQRRRRSG